MRTTSEASPSGRRPSSGPAPSRPRAARADRSARPPGRAYRRVAARRPGTGGDLTGRICRAVRAGDAVRVERLLDRLEQIADDALLDRVARAVRALALPPSS
ncbi:hypothetical protein GCM10025734_10310 [Kitasatospora paranensis]|uniref:hypothetical protein n=1 Tax=Kitasatospora paranensis TaxID=258053 RepID=UPI0031EDCEB1